MDEIVRTNPIGSLVKRGAFNRLLFGGNVRLMGFSSTYAGVKDQNWSIAKTIDQETGQINYTSSAGVFLPEIVNKMGAKDIYIPTCADANAKICNEADFQQIVSMQNSGHEVAVHRGARADAMTLSPGMTLGFAVAGCPVLLLWRRDTETLGVSHLGMRSLINDWKLGNWRATYRSHESVVSKLVYAMGGTGRGVLEQFRAVIAFPIDPELLTYPWKHEEFGGLNERRSTHVAHTYGPECAPGFLEGTRRYLGLLDLYRIARTQLIRLGVSKQYIRVIRPPRGWYNTREHPGRFNFVSVRYLV